MRINEARIGVRIKSLVDFSGVPKGTEGVIDEDYGTGVMVAWDLPDQPLPKDYLVSSFRRKNVLRDGFNKKDELHFLEIV